MFGLLLGIGVKLVGEVAYAISDMQHLSTPCGYTQNNEPYYINRKGETFAQNGEKIIPRRARRADGSTYYKEVGASTGKTYFDSEIILQEKEDKENEKNRKRAIELGNLSYVHNDRTLNFYYYLHPQVTKEISTGKAIGRLEYNRFKKECRKYYLKPNARSGWDVDENDEGIVITPYECIKLDALFGTHSAIGIEELLHDINSGKIKHSEEDLKKFQNKK